MYSCFNGATSQPYRLEQDVTAAAKAGFRALELWGDKFTAFFRDRSIGDLAALLQSHRLQPAAIDFIAVDLTSEEPLSGALSALARYGPVAEGIDCDTLLLVVLGERPDLSQPQALNYIAKLMLPLSSAAARYGLRLGLEPLGEHPYVRGPVEALEVIRTSRQDNLGLSWDFFHSFKSGVPLADLRRIPPGKLLMVHANDLPDRDPATLQDSDRLFPGEGVLPLDDYFEVLREMGYAGPVSVEAPNPVYAQLDPDSLAREAFESLEQYLPLRV